MYGEAGDFAGLGLDVVCPNRFFFSSKRNNTSKCCPKRHRPSNDLDPHGHWERYLFDRLVMASPLGLMAETLAFSSTHKLVAKSLNSLAICVLENTSGIIERRRLRQLLLLGMSSCSYRPLRLGTSTP